MISPIDKPIKAPILSGEIPRNPWDIHGISPRIWDQLEFSGFWNTLDKKYA
jgi:hypothetical protein